MTNSKQGQQTQHMKRRDFLRGVAGAACGVGIAERALGAQARQLGDRRPNIIFVLADDVSAKEFSLYGGEGIATPELDRMGHEGLFFETAWTAPVCGPSRCLLRTGRYAFRTQYYENAIGPATPTHRTHIELAEALHDAGYATLMAGKNHDGTPPAEKGYDDWCTVTKWDGYDGTHQSPDWGGRVLRERGMYAVQWYFHPALVTPEGGIPTTAEDFGPDLEVDYIRKFISRRQDRPFFVYWPTNLPHMMYGPERKWHYTDVPERDAKGTRTGRRRAGSLKSNLEYLDYLLGCIRGELEGQGLERDTVIFFAGDNGTAGYGKHQLRSEIGPRVAFVVHGPGHVPSLGARPELVDFSDVLPTCLDLAEAALPDGYEIDGHSFAPLLRGKDFDGRDWIFVQMGEARWLRDERWLLDGNGRFWDCGKNRDETKGYCDVTESHAPEVVAARKRFQAILEKMPGIDYEHPETSKRWASYLKTHEKLEPYRPPYLDK